MARILFVDGEKDVREVWTEVLKKEGYEVTAVATKEEAIDTVKKTEPPFDLVIVDMRLGHEREGGLQVMKEVRFKDPFTEMIVFTVCGNLDNVYKSMEFYIWQYISKTREDAEKIFILEVAKALEHKRLAERGIKKELIPVPLLTKENEKELLGILKEYGYLTEDKLKKALAEQKERDEGIGRLLVKMGFISQECLNWALSRVLNIPYVHISPEMIDSNLIMDISADFLREHCLIPMLKVENELTVVMADPTDFEAIKEVQNKHLGCEIRVCLGTAVNIIEMIDTFSPCCGGGKQV